jgi:hypothetical protein
LLVVRGRVDIGGHMDDDACVHVYLYRDYAWWMDSILMAASEGTKKGEIFRPSPLAASLLSQEVQLPPAQVVTLSPRAHNSP